MPGYANLFDRLFESPTALVIAARCDSPAKLIELGRNRLSRHLAKNKICHQLRTIDKVLAWAGSGEIQSDGPMHHAIWTDLHELYQHFHRKIAALERELAGDLVQTPTFACWRFPASTSFRPPISGRNGTDLAVCQCECHYRAQGFFPSRHQSDQTDHDNGPIIRQANRRLRCVLMRIADNLACHCNYYRGKATRSRTGHR